MFNKNNTNLYQKNHLGLNGLNIN